MGHLKQTPISRTSSSATPPPSPFISLASAATVRAGETAIEPVSSLAHFAYSSRSAREDTNHNSSITRLDVATMAPRGRGSATGREARSAAKANGAKTSRGGIQKRGRTKRIDGDGDLDMDSTARTRKPAAASASTTRTRPTTRSTVNLNSKGPSRTAQNVLKQLANGTAGSLAARVSRGGPRGKSRQQNTAGLSFLRVGGLKQSRASNNPGGGLTDLLAFLERKAASFGTGKKKNIAIKKVS